MTDEQPKVTVGGALRSAAEAVHRPTVGSPAWEELCQRRADLIRRKVKFAGLPAAEAAELDRLDALSESAILEWFPFRPDPATRYWELWVKLDARLAAGLDDAEADAIRDQMDRPWHAMTADERQATIRRTIGFDGYRHPPPDRKAEAEALVARLTSGDRGEMT